MELTTDKHPADKRSKRGPGIQRGKKDASVGVTWVGMTWLRFA